MKRKHIQKRYRSSKLRNITHKNHYNNSQLKIYSNKVNLAKREYELAHYRWAKELDKRHDLFEEYKKALASFKSKFKKNGYKMSKSIEHSYYKQIQLKTEIKNQELIIQKAKKEEDRLWDKYAHARMTLHLLQETKKLSTNN